MVLPAGERTIPYGRSTRRDIKATFPNILFGVRFDNSKLVKATVWCIKPDWEKKLTAGSTEPVLAPFPYGNVYGHGGICWGSTHITDLRQPYEVQDVFFTSGFNGDLYSPGSLGVNDPSLGELVTRTKAQLPAPISGSYNKSVQQMAQELAR